MKILVVTDVYYPRVSGVTHIIDQTYSHLLEKGEVDSVDLVCKWQPETTKAVEMINGINVHYFKSLSILGGRIMAPSPEMIKVLIDTIREVNPDQIHLHTRFSVVNPFALTIAKFFGKEVVHVEHLAGYVTGESLPLTTASWLWDQFVARYIYLLTDKIVTVSHSSGEFINSALQAPKSKITVIENASALKASTTTYKKKMAKKKKFTIFYAARFVQTKNPLIVIGAMKALKDMQRGYDFELILAGEGKLKEEMLEYIKDNQLEDVIDYVGKLSHKEMLETYAKSDIFLNPTRLEGLPGGVLEAQLNTNLVIVTDIGGNKDVIRDDMFKISLDELTPESLALKIHTVIQNLPEAIEKAEANKKWAAQHFTWDNVVKKYVDHILPKKSKKK